MGINRDRCIGMRALLHFMSVANAPMPAARLDDSVRKAARAQFGIPVDAEPIQWFTVNATASNAAGTQAKKTAEILIYDIIDPWGVSAGDFANALNALDVDEITVGINSPGGLVFDGIAIMNALKRHPAKIISRIDGRAASAASFIAMAGDEILTSKYAEMMIHEAWGAVQGDAEDMKAMADLLIRHNQTIASVYADRAGGEVKDWLKLMKAETWFSADEMVAAGLADTIIEDPADSSGADKAESLKNRFDLSIFNYAGRSEAPPPEIRNHGSRAKKGTTVATLKEQLAEKHDLDATLDDDAFAAALEAKLAEDSDSDDTSAGEGTPDGAENSAAAGELASAAAVLAKYGLKPVDADTLDAVKTQSQQGAEAFKALQAQNDAALIDNAIRAGKIAPASRDKWAKNLAGAARDMFIEALNNAEAVFPVQEVGHGGNPDPGASMTGPDDLSWFDTADTEPSNSGE